MQNHPNDGSNDNPDEFSEFRKDDNRMPENHREGAARAGNSAENGADVPNSPKPNTFASNTPNYGEFGGVTNNNTTAGTNDVYSHSAGNNPGGVAAPNVTEPDQRGAAPQNRATGTVLNNLDSDDEVRREANKEDDPRYGSGTRNWATNEPANRSTGPEDPNDTALS
ncbi:hypothetical protein [Hymenobacter chitinivorans]|uniref:Uncharacterized protein n=1 Tax=Hymenobacter chitinivorans DSM 11115 TaxID=1121954 RepID=A0A2M9BN62_9BACT|nr:hypothetical protein [Hymenobacter chitinivorans]PJJ59387.1 hypothetical protein CLV45_0804 [Hymenobacter chitinivorans DSM 11115]